jgi:hypothetical protein
MSNQNTLESIDCCYGSRRQYGAEGSWCHCHGRCGCMLQVATPWRMVITKCDFKSQIFDKGVASQLEETRLFQNDRPREDIQHC